MIETKDEDCNIKKSELNRLLRLTLAKLKQQASQVLAMYNMLNLLQALNYFVVWVIIYGYEEFNK